jgi:catechol 2,3-dioxygenase-like lactoylglutathione lyase family enzyme
VNFQIAAFDSKTPWPVGAARKSDTDAIVRDKVLRRFGFAALREISRRTGDDNRLFVGNAHRNHVAFIRVCARRPSRRKPMTITLNHTIVWARDKEGAARFFAEIFGLRFVGSGGNFAPVRVNDTLTLDFADAKGTIASQHYAFHVSDTEFDAILQRVKDAGLTFGSGPRSLEDESSTIGTAAVASITRTTTATSSS